LDSTGTAASATAAATGAAAGAATVGLAFFAAAAAGAAGAAGCAEATTGAAESDFFVTFLAAGWAVDGLLIVLIPVEVFDIIKRGMTIINTIIRVKFYSNWNPVVRSFTFFYFFLLK
jgi:hypothetical protein